MTIDITDDERQLLVNLLTARICRLPRFGILILTGSAGFFAILPFQVALDARGAAPRIGKGITFTAGRIAAIGRYGIVGGIDGPSRQSRTVATESRQSA